MPDGGSLTITGDSNATGVTVRVSDTGPGIPEEDLEAVFDRFVRSSDSSGSGLGLSIARDLVEAHSGTIRAENGPGGGASFVVHLPSAG
jgi:signal transduction histidine kinase